GPFCATSSEVGRSFALAIISNGLICVEATTRGAVATAHAPAPISIRTAAIRLYAVTPDSPLTRRSINGRMNRSYVALLSRTCEFECIQPTKLFSLMG